MELSPNLVAIGAIAVILLMVVAVVVSRELRKRALAAFAAESGYEFHSTVPLEEAIEFTPAEVRRLNAAGNRIEGEIGPTRFAVLDVLYARRTSSLSGKTIRTTVGSVPYSGPVFGVAPGDPAESSASVPEPVQRFCLAHPRYAVESTGSHLLYFSDGVRVPPTAYEQFLADLRSLDEAVRGA